MASDREVEFSSAFVDRLRAAMGDTSQAVVAKRADISTSGLSKILQGAEPGAFKIVRLARALDVNLEWLLTGKGQPNAAAGGYAELPILDVRLAAGAASLSDAVQTIGMMPVDFELLRSMGRNSADGLVALGVEGDSMEPLIADGARAVTDTRDTRLREGIFAFRLGDELRVKRLRRLGVDAVEVISENTRYEPEVISGEMLGQFVILGRVLATVSPV